MPPLLRAHRLAVALGERTVLRDVSFRVRPGERIAVVGANGAGKTTLLRAVAGLIPSSGTLELSGRPVQAWPHRERARRIALVRQQADLAVDFTAREVVALGRAPWLGWTERLADADRERVEAALAAVDLLGLADRPVTQLSGGEQQRVALAQALAQDAPLVLLDEPTAHLDVRHQLDLAQRLVALSETGKTVVAAVHDLELAARVADRVWVLSGGTLAADGAPQAVLTPDRLRESFGVEAEVEAGPDGIRVRYLGVARGQPPTPAP